MIKYLLPLVLMSSVSLATTPSDPVTAQCEKDVQTMHSFKLPLRTASNIVIEQLAETGTDDGNYCFIDGKFKNYITSEPASRVGWVPGYWNAYMWFTR